MARGFRQRRSAGKAPSVCSKLAFACSTMPAPQAWQFMRFSRKSTARTTKSYHAFHLRKAPLRRLPLHTAYAASRAVQTFHPKKRRPRSLKSSRIFRKPQPSAARPLHAASAASVAVYAFNPEKLRPRSLKSSRVCGKSQLAVRSLTPHCERRKPGGSHIPSPKNRTCAKSFLAFEESHTPLPLVRYTLQPPHSALHTPQDERFRYPSEKVPSAQPRAFTLLQKAAPSAARPLHTAYAASRAVQTSIQKSPIRTAKSFHASAESRRSPTPHCKPGGSRVTPEKPRLPPKSLHAFAKSRIPNAASRTICPLHPEKRRPRTPKFSCVCKETQPPALSRSTT